MKSFRFFALLGIFFLFQFTGYAQDNRSERDSTKQEESDSEPSLIDKLRFGGNFSLSFGTNTFVEVSPYITYKLSEPFNIGIGATYMYYRLRYFNAPGAYETSVYGGRIFGRYTVLPPYGFVHVEYESLSTQYYNTNKDLARGFVEAGLIGGGYRSPIGNRGAFVITILYNLMYNQARSPYASPLVYRVGIEF